jgi:hypothetical protein
MVDRARRQQRRHSVESTGPASAELYDCRRAQRDTENMLEHGAVSVPADTRARVVAQDQSLDEGLRFQAGEPCCLGVNRQQPVRKRILRPEAAGVKIVPPAVGRGQSLAESAVEAKRQELRRVDRAGQRLFLIRRNDILCLGQTGESGLIKQLGLKGDDAHSGSAPFWKCYLITYSYF